MFIESNEVKSRVFYQYKILVSLPDQLSFDSIAYANLSPRQIKNDVLRNIYNYLSESRDYIEITSANKKIIIRKEMALNNDIICFKLAAQRELSYTAKKTDFTNERMADFPYSYVFLDVVAQTFYVEKNYKIFNKPSEMYKILQQLLKNINTKTNQFLDVEFLINLIVDKREFMESFKSFDSVSKVSLKLNSPNSFLGNQKADEYLNALREETNAEQMTLEICNNDVGIDPNGFLSHFENLFEYAVNGGGEWILKGYENGKSLSRKSSARGKTLVLDVDLTNIPENVDRLVVRFAEENRYEED